MRESLVFGGNGTLGKKIVDRLLKLNDRKVTMVTRSKVDLNHQYFNLAQGSMEDDNFLQKCFQERTVKDVFLIMPNSLKKESGRVTESILNLAKLYGVEKIIFISSYIKELNGEVNYLINLEKKIKQLNSIKYVILRSSFFFDNLKYDLIAPKKLVSGFLPDLKLNYISTSEVADISLKMMLKNTSSSLELNLIGREYLSMNDIANLIGGDYEMKANESMLPAEYSFFKAFNENNLALFSNNDLDELSCSNKSYSLSCFLKQFTEEKYKKC